MAGGPRNGAQGGVLKRCSLLPPFVAIGVVVVIPCEINMQKLWTRQCEMYEKMYSLPPCTSNKMVYANRMLWTGIYVGKNGGGGSSEVRFPAGPAAAGATNLTADIVSGRIETATNVVHHCLTRRAQGPQGPTCLAGSVLCVSAIPIRASRNHFSICALSTSRFFHVRLVVLILFPLWYVYSLLLPLNVCRKDKYYLPWECENERHAYEKYVSSFLSVVYLAHKIASR